MKKILVVDDSLLIRNIIKNELSNYGFEVIEAKNGQEAVDNFEAHSPDLITMDITMPSMSGLEAAEKIMESNPEAKIIMVTAIGDDDIISQAIKLGIKDFIVKPFEAERLVSAIKKYI